MKATFRIKDGDKVIKQYEMEVASAKELNTEFHEARKVWDEYMVEAETESFTLTYSHTYADERKDCAKSYL